MISRKQSAAEHSTRAFAYYRLVEELKRTTILCDTLQEYQLKQILINQTIIINKKLSLIIGRR